MLVPFVKIKKDGIVDFNELYRSTKKYLEDYGLLKDEEELEKKFIDRTKPGGVKQLEIAWEARKKISSFFVYVIKIWFLIIGMTDVEVQQRDIKRKLQKASFEIRMDAYIETTGDLENIGGLKRIYLNFVIPKRIEGYKADLYDKAYKLHTFMKEFMGMRD